MITRPLDLASRMRPEPRNLDWLFYVNGGLLVLFFSLFGSRFVLASGVTLLPEIAGANAGAQATTHYIRVHSERQIFAGDGLRNMEELKAWFDAEAKTVKRPVLLVQANENVSIELIARIKNLAEPAGFIVHFAAVEPATRRGPGAK